MRLEVGIIALVAEALGVPAERRAQFEWLKNKPTAEHFGEHYPKILRLFEELGGDKGGLFGKADGYLIPDAYFPEPYHFIFEFDELQHFTARRQKTLTLYPADVRCWRLIGSNICGSVRNTMNRRFGRERIGFGAKPPTFPSSTAERRNAPSSIRFATGCRRCTGFVRRCA